MKSKLIILVFLSLIGAKTSLYGQNHTMIHYTIDEGLPHHTVFSTLCDREGYMWFATSSGVAKYDGYEWEYFTTKEGLSDNDILGFYQDKKGRIWFVTFNGTFSYYLNGKFYNSENNTTLGLAAIKSGISSIYEDSHETKWAIPIDRDLFVSFDDFKVKHFDIDEYRGNVKGFFFESEDTLTLYTNMGLFKHQEDQFVKQSNSMPIPINNRSYHIDNDTLYYTSKAGIVKLTPDNSYEIIIPEEYIPQLSQLSDLYIDSNYSLWFTTLNNGVYKYDNFLNANYSFKQYLPNEVVTSCVEDLTGNIWFGTIGNGVYMLPYSYTSNFSLTTQDGLLSNRVTSIYKSEDEVVWVGDVNGYIYKYHNEKLIKAIDLNGLWDKSLVVNNPILGIVKRRNEVFVQTNNGLIFFKDDGYFELNVINTKAKFKYSPKKMILDSLGRITVGHTKGVSVLNSVDGVYILESMEGTPNARVFTYTVSRDGVIWYVNKEGLFRYEKGESTVYNLEECDIHQRIKDIAILPDSTLVLTTNGDGVIFTKDEHLKYKISKRTGISSDILSKIYMQNDTLWVSSYSGLDRLVYENGSIADIMNFRTGLGLHSDQINDVILDSDALLIANDKGVMELDKSYLDLNSTPPIVKIAKFQVNDLLHISDKIILKNEDNVIHIECVVINYNDKESLTYQYRLKGVSDDWTTTKNKHFDFTSLNADTYTFEYRAKRLNSEWSAAQSISFTIEPSLWMHPIMIVLYIIIITGFISLIIFKISSIRNAKQLSEYELSFKIKSLEQKALQAMMNPHFIFNVLNSIQYYLSAEDSYKAQLNLTKFAKLIRRNLEINQQKFISIEEEMEYLELYLSLEKLRFGTSFLFKINVADNVDVMEAKIPTMLIQPFVENAIWHGVMPQGGKGDVVINFMSNSYQLVIEVFDNGVGYSPDNKKTNTNHKSVGLKMTKERLSLMEKIYQEVFNYKIEKIENDNSLLSGTLVTITLPLRQ